MAAVRAVALLWLLVVMAPGARPAENLRLGRYSLTEAAETFLRQTNAEGSRACTRLTQAMWEHYTNVTEQNRRATEVGRARFQAWEKEAWQRAQVFKETAHLLSPDLARQLKFLSVLRTGALPKRELEEYTELRSRMMHLYSTAKTCDFRNQTQCDLSLSPDLNMRLRTCNNYDELSYVWRTWRDSSGKRIRPLYPRYVELSNMAAKINGFESMGDLWLSSFGEDGRFAQDVNRAYQQLVPLYRQLHAYVRRKLREVYGPEHVSFRGPIPANLLGNMWAQQWDEIYFLVKPYPRKESIDVTKEMILQGFTPHRMFELADNFFVSMGLPRLPASFWNDSLIEKPLDREVLCHASAWDFCNGKDYRIHMCTEVNMKGLQTVYHEVGHIHYYMQYAHLPFVFQGGANEAFHEALGDLLGMIAGTPTHLHRVGLLPKLKEDQEIETNYLLHMALSKVVFLPFGYLVDYWRWDVFNDKVREPDWNCNWWKRRVELQGVKPPVHRTEADFDPGAKYHVAAGKPYLKYLVSTVLQFQFHRALCLKAGQYNPTDPTKPLHKCDITDSIAAGTALKAMMKLGRSVDWREALRVVTGSEGKLDASAIREFFRPLELWLVWDNAMHGEHVGWKADGQYCTPT